MPSKTWRSSRWSGSSPTPVLRIACFLFISVVCQQVSGFKLDCNMPDNQSVCSGTVCQDVANIDIIVALCPHYCGYCPTQCTDYVGNGVTCGDVAGICQDPLGQELCPLSCLNCKTPAQVCADHVAPPYTCQDLPGVCSDTALSQQLCPKSCNKCVTTPASTTAPTSATTTPVPVDPMCVDNIGNGLSCSRIPNICQDRYAGVFCRRFCNLCTGSPPSTQSPTSPSPPGDCVDHVVGPRKCTDLPFICSDQFARVFCPKTCALCPACTDNTIKGLTCQQIDHVCNSTYGAKVCQRTCNTCSGPAPSPASTAPPVFGTCDDFVGNGQTCAGLPGVCQDPEKIGPVLLCPKYCGTCTRRRSAREASIEQRAAASGGRCVDYIGNGKFCADYSNICSKSYGPTICPKHCGTCGGATLPPNPTCVDYVTNGLDCYDIIQQSPSHCMSPISQVICKKSCGHCNPSTSPPTSSATTTAPPTTHATTTQAPPATSPPTQPPVTSTSTVMTSTSTSTVMTTSPGSTTTPCMDTVFGTRTCAEVQQQLPNIDICMEASGRITCPAFCGLCPTQPGSTAAPCRPRQPQTNCSDFADFAVCNLHGFCADPYAMLVCQKTCNACEIGCVDHLATVGDDCQDLIGPGKTFATVNDLCKDDLASSVCELTCGCKDFCPP